MKNYAKGGGLTKNKQSELPISDDILPKKTVGGPEDKSTPAGAEGVIAQIESKSSQDEIAESESEAAEVKITESESEAAEVEIAESESKAAEDEASIADVGDEADTASDDSYNLSILERDILEAFFPAEKGDEDNSSASGDGEIADSADDTSNSETSDAGDTADGADDISAPEVCENAEELADESTELPGDEQICEGGAEISLSEAISEPDTEGEHEVNDGEADEVPSGGEALADEEADEKNSDTEQLENDEAEGTPSYTEDSHGADTNTTDKVLSLPDERSSDNRAAAKTVNERRIDSIFDIFELFIISLVAVLIVMTFFFRHAVVEGSSMENTLFEGEHIIISDFMYTPERGDIIVFEDRTIGIEGRLVKRVIAVGGDRVQITYSGDVYVNGTLLTEDYAVHDTPIYTPDNTVRYKVDITVPDGELFVMGDNRPVSADSRDPRIGTISEDSVLGRVLIRFYPFDKFGTVE